MGIHPCWELYSEIAVTGCPYRSRVRMEHDMVHQGSGRHHCPGVAVVAGFVRSQCEFLLGVRREQCYGPGSQSHIWYTGSNSDTFPPKFIYKEATFWGKGGPQPEQVRARVRLGCRSKHRFGVSELSEPAGQEASQLPYCILLRRTVMLLLQQCGGGDVPGAIIGAFSTCCPCKTVLCLGRNTRQSIHRYIRAK